VAEDEVRGDRRDLVEPGLAELALDVVLLGEAEAAVGLQAHVGGEPAGLGGHELGHVGLGAAGLAGLEHRRRPCRPSGWPRSSARGAGQRELHALVLADRAAEHDAVLGVLAGRSMKNCASPMHSAAIRIRSAFIPSRM
jgi:hypothetical protein